MRHLFLKTAALCTIIAERVYQFPDEVIRRAKEKRIKAEMKRRREQQKKEREAPWNKVQGDKTLRLDYDLDKNSIVFDVGGFRGQWASDIFSKYCCAIYIFEPVLKFGNKIEERFAKNPNIHVFQFGLSDKTEKGIILVDEDSSSFVREGEEYREVDLVKTIDFIRKHNIDTISLMKINIEGGEYDLLEHLIDSGFIRNIENIQVQFHDLDSNTKERMKKIQKTLRKTHFLTYQYPFVWENWRIEYRK